VYSIVSVQLLVTILSVALFAVAPVDFLRGPGSWGAAIPLLSFACSSIAWMFMYSSTNARRSSPLKWQLLSVFTLGEAIMVGFLSSFYTPRSVMAGLLATAVAAGGVSTYTILNRNSERDLSQWGMMLSSIGLAFVAYGFMTLLMYAGIIPFGVLPYRESVYGMLGATLFSFYLAYHTRTIVTGKHTQHQMNEKDYVFGASTFFFYVFFAWRTEHDAHGRLFVCFINSDVVQ
jgi:protein lifeguard